MAVSAAIDFRADVVAFFDLFDHQDIEGIRRKFADDVQGVDEISRAWLRGVSAIDSYFSQLESMDVSDIHSTVTDIDVRHWDDVALVTCMADQTYRVAGEPTAITAPVSMLYRRDHGEWKVELIHAVPLPAAD